MIPFHSSENSKSEFLDLIDKNMQPISNNKTLSNAVLRKVDSFILTTFVGSIFTLNPECRYKIVWKTNSGPDIVIYVCFPLPHAQKSLPTFPPWFRNIIWVTEFLNLFCQTCVFWSRNLNASQ